MNLTFKNYPSNILWVVYALRYFTHQIPYYKEKTLTLIKFEKHLNTGFNTILYRKKH